MNEEPQEIRTQKEKQIMHSSVWGERKRGPTEVIFFPQIHTLVLLSYYLYTYELHWF